MTRLAVDAAPRLEVSTLELERPGPSYTVDTLGELLARYGPETELFLVMGQDALLDLPNWKEPHRIVALAWLAVALRSPGREFDLTELEKAIPGVSQRLVDAADVVRGRERDGDTGVGAKGRVAGRPRAAAGRSVHQGTRPLFDHPTIGALTAPRPRPAARVLAGAPLRRFRWATSRWHRRRTPLADPRRLFARSGDETSPERM